ncbi:MAG TPA: PRC-barrel domain-containing protein [Xanthobacteraceae bacterium]|nr:PRC-barrel domain-containing protein [Xanthobacteraceae bacterium]
MASLDTSSGGDRNSRDSIKDAARAAANLIGTDDIEGAPVYRASAGRIGEIEQLLFDKFSGKATYVVVKIASVGGSDVFLPIPWSHISYNDKLACYEVDLSDGKLADAPRYRRESPWDWTSPKVRRRIYDYYHDKPSAGF